MRLRLREFVPDDAPFIIELVNTRGWIENIGDRNIHTYEDAIRYIQNGPMRSYAMHGFGLYLVEKKEDDAPIGMCGILRRDYLEIPDIGFAFLPEYHRMGFAYEVARATINYAREQLGIPAMSAITLAKNSSSIKLLGKLGLSFRKIVHIKETDEDLLLFNNDIPDDAVSSFPK
jgi:RimJ/RimL family protein N-acetyltransferase